MWIKWWEIWISWPHDNINFIWKIMTTGPLALQLGCSPNTQETGVQSQVDSYQRLKKIVLDASLLNPQHYKVRVKCSSRGKGVAPFPTLRCNSSWKGSLRVPINYGRQLYIPFTYIILLLALPRIKIIYESTFCWTKIDSIFFLSEAVLSY